MTPAAACGDAGRAPHLEYSLAAQPGGNQRVNRDSAGRGEETQPRVAISRDSSFVTISSNPRLTVWSTPATMRKVG